MLKQVQEQTLLLILKTVFTNYPACGYLHLFATKACLWLMVELTLCHAMLNRHYHLYTMPAELHCQVEPIALFPLPDSNLKSNKDRKWLSVMLQRHHHLKRLVIIALHQARKIYQLHFPIRVFLLQNHSFQNQQKVCLQQVLFQKNLTGCFQW